MRRLLARPARLGGWLLAGWLILQLAACRPTPLQEQQAYVFGTRVEVIVVGSEPELARDAIAAVLREFDRLHQTYHAWQPSALTELNSAIAAGRPWTVSPELAALLKEAQGLTAQGSGLFDPGIGRLIALWGFQSDEFAAQLPEQSALAGWLAAHPGIADLQIEGNRVSSRSRQVALDFGGYLKGVALDRAAAILRQRGINNALINIGGNVMALGSKEGRPWRVGIQHPRQPGPLATLQLHDGEAIGTSGDYQRFFELDGKRYSHLLDPRSGWPVEHTQAVTIVVPAQPANALGAGTLSDAASKPLFVAGPAHWREQAQRLGIDQVLRVDRDQSIEITASLKSRLELRVAESDTTIRVVP